MQKPSPTITPRPTLEIVPDVRAAAAQLADLPTLLRTAEPADARAILAEVLDVVYLMPHAAMAVRPTTKLAQEWRELRLKCHLWWAGWAPAGLRHYS